MLDNTEFVKDAFMKKWLLLGCWLLFVLLPGAAAAIETKDFFEHAKFNNIKISPDGKNIAFTYQEDTEVKLAVMRLEDKKILSGFAFGENKHVVNFHWGNDSRVLMEVAEITGNLVNMTALAVLSCLRPESRLIESCIYYRISQIGS
jgi:hypothetical protein